MSEIDDDHVLIDGYFKEKLGKWEDNIKKILKELFLRKLTGLKNDSRSSSMMRPAVNVVEISVFIKGNKLVGS
jgi:hypothetical protein